MAQATIGALRVVLGIDSAAFEKGLNEAQKRLASTQKKVAKFGASMQKTGAVITAGVTSVVGGLAALTGAAVNSFAEMDNLATVAGIGVERFKILTLAAAQFGVGQEKLSDILKDVNDKFGDYFQTGAGPLADFFDNIAPKVGLTAESFKGLSSEQALGKYVQALQDANVNQQEMTFYMEAIASDATLLTPLFKDNAAAIDDVANKAKEMGLRFDSDMIAKAKEAKAEFSLVSDVLKTNVQAALVDLVPAIAELGKVFIPMLQGVAKWVASVAERFKNLSPETQRFIGILTALGVAAGPVVVVLGTLVAALAALISPIGLIVAALIGGAGLIALMVNWKDATQKAKKANEELYELLGDSRVIREQHAGDTRQAIQLQLNEAKAIREKIKAQIEANKVQLETQRAILEKKNAGFGTGFAADAKKAKAQQRILELTKGIAEAEKELVANTQRSIELAEMQMAMDMSAAESAKAVVVEKAKAVEILQQTAVATTLASDAQEIWNQKLADAKIAMSDAVAEAARLAEAHTNTVANVQKEIEENALLVEALKVSQREYEITIEVLRILEDGYLGGADGARQMAIEVLNSRDALAEAQDALKKTDAVAKQTGDTFADSFSKATDSVTSLISAFKNGDIEGIISGIGSVLEGLSGGGSGGGLGGIAKSIGSFFGGFRADGGPVSSGTSYIVGERGPELFTPRGNGQIIPNHMMGGGGGSTVRVEPSPYFDVVVDERATNVAVPISQATSQGAAAGVQRQNAFSRARAL